MMVEINQHSDYQAGLAQLVRSMKQHRGREGFVHPLVRWLKVNPVSSPTLFFDIGSIELRMQWLEQITRPLSISALLSVKSCTDPIYLGAANTYLDGFDISNPAEYACLPQTLNDKLVSIASPVMDFDIAPLTTRGNSAVVVLDSQAQLDRFLAQRADIPYLLRLQACELVSSNDSAFYPRTRFGFTVEEVQQVLRQPQLIANPPSGFHLHHGSEVNTEATYLSMISGLKALTQQLPMKPRCINLGGGWHGLKRAVMAKVLSQARSTFGAPCTLLVEPGRWYGKHAGFAAGTLVNQKATADTTECVLNLSKDAHLKWSQVKLLFSMPAMPKKFREVRFFGASCYEEDVLGKFLVPYEKDFHSEPGFALGSQVIFGGISPYSAAWNTTFNGISKARTVWWRHGILET